MKTFKILLAVVTIMLFSNLLSGCSTQQISQAEFYELTRANLAEAREMKKVVTMELVQVPGAESLTLQLVAHNPSQKPLSSAEMWLAYPAESLKGISFEPNVEAFEMTAPYQNGFDAQAGLFKFGRSTTQPVTDSTVVLGTLHFKKQSHGSNFIDAYDYHFDLSGHTSVNMMLNGEPVNILIPPHSPLFVSQK